MVQEEREVEEMPIRKNNKRMKPVEVQEEEDEDLGDTIKRRTRRVMKPDDEESYDVNEPTVDHAKPIETKTTTNEALSRKSQMDEYLSKMAYSKP
jgi:hypothetical protein